MDFRILGPVTDIATIAYAPSIREIRKLERRYGHGRWGKRVGKVLVELSNGDVRRAEIHWYEATGIGRYDLKIKRFTD